jgi:hypothetical protein
MGCRLRLPGWSPTGQAVSRRSTKQRRAARWRRTVTANVRWTPTRSLLHNLAVLACRMPWSRLRAQQWKRCVNMDAVEREHP